MCHYITATVKKSTPLEVLSEIAKSHGLHFIDIKNEFVEQQLPQGTTYLWKKSSHCDCGTALGCMNLRNQQTETDREGETKRLRRKGWSEAKIQRWIEEKEKASDKKESRNELYRQSQEPRAEEWVKFLKDAVANPAVGEFGLLLHFYKTGPERETIELKRQETTSVHTLSPDFLMTIDEDVLYVFRK
jgi:hypothetical protein